MSPTFGRSLTPRAPGRAFTLIEYNLLLSRPPALPAALVVRRAAPATHRPGALGAGAREVRGAGHTSEPRAGHADIPVRLNADLTDPAWVLTQRGDGYLAPGPGELLNVYATGSKTVLIARCVGGLVDHDQLGELEPCAGTPADRAARGHYERTASALADAIAAQRRLAWLPPAGELAGVWAELLVERNVSRRHLCS